jgi:serine/threonine protein phosphatase 1
MLLATFSKNQQGTDYVCGDIHGNYTQLLSVLQALNFDTSKDRLFCVGDITDRGSDDLLTTTLLDEPWFFSILGNHEQIILSNFLSNSNNGTDWARSIIKGDNQDDKKALKQYKAKLSNLPILIELEAEIGKIGLVHAVAQDSWAETIVMAEQDATMLLGDYFGVPEAETIWSRRIKYSGGKEYYAKTPCVGIDYTISGHNVFAEPFQLNNRLFIDTGFFFGNRGKPYIGKLTVVNAKTGDINCCSANFQSNEVVGIIKTKVV